MAKILSLLALQERDCLGDHVSGALGGFDVQYVAAISGANAV